MILLVGVLTSGIPQVEIDENIKEMLPKNIASRRALVELEDIYGGSDVFLVAFHHEPTVFNPKTLANVKAFTDSLEAMPEVARVASLATTNQIKCAEWGLEVIPFMEEAPETEEAAEEIEARVFADSLQIGKLVSQDGKWTTIIAILKKETAPKVVYNEITRLSQSFTAQDEIVLTGMPVIMSYVSENIKDDLRRLVPFVIFIVALILFLSFRTVIGVILPLMVALLSTMSMVGLMGHLGKKFMVLNNVMPVILIAVGISYAIHLLVGFYREIGVSGDKRQAIITTLDHIGTPVLLAGLTTMIGFLSLATAPLPVYLDFGILLAFGVLMATLLTMTLVPALLMLLPIPKHKLNRSRPGLLDRLLDAWGANIFRFRKLVLVFGLAATVIFALGLPLVVMDMNPITFFPQSHPMRIADQEVNDELGGSANLNLMFTGDAQSHEIMAAMDDVQTFLEKFPETGSTLSMATMVKKINRMLHEDDPRMETLPDSREGIAQAILMYSMSGSPQDFEMIIDNNYENAQVMARMKSVSTKRTSVITEAVEHYLQQAHPEVGKVKATGIIVFMKDLARMVIISQVRSLLMSIVLMAMVTWITYRSLCLGILAVIPLSLTVVINFGLMGLAGIALSIPTAVISSIIIGIGVDFALHFLSRYKLELSKVAEPSQAVVAAIRHAGKPILFDATPTAIGFLVLLSSGFLPIRYAGMLIALTMMICAGGALTILASALTFYKPKLHNFKGIYHE